MENKSMADTKHWSMMNASVNNGGEQLVQKVRHIYTSKKFSDLTIYLSDEKEPIQTHRLLLALFSPVFEEQLFGRLAVSDTLHLCDSAKGFHWLLDYIYCGVCHFPCTAVALEVAHLASKYQMVDVMLLCSEYLKRVLNDLNYLSVYNAAVHLGNNDLIDQCAQLIQGSNTDVFSSQQIVQLSPYALEHLLQQPCSLVDEVVVFRAVVTWGKSQLGARNRDITPHDLRQELQKFLPYIRILTLSPEQFVSEVIPTEIFSTEESVTILCCICGNKDATPPPVCCSSRQKRNVAISFQQESSN